MNSVQALKILAALILLNIKRLRSFSRLSKRNTRIRLPDPHATRGKLIDFLLSEFLEPTLIQPTFLYNYPRDISPLAKSIPGDPLTVERFEAYTAGFELCNAFTELNDPLDQEQRFLEMGRRLRGRR